MMVILGSLLGDGGYQCFWKPCRVGLRMSEGGGVDCFCSLQRGGVRKGSMKILLSSSITIN